MSCSSTLSPPIELPEIQGAQTIEFCATLVVVHEPRPTRFKFLAAAVRLLAALTRPTHFKVHVVPQIKMGGIGIHTAGGDSLGLGDSVSMRVAIPGQESKESCPMSAAALSPVQQVPEVGCGCAFCKGYWYGSIGARATSRERHRLGISRN